MNEVEELARARYGPPDKLKTTVKTAQWHTPDHGRLIVNRVEGYFRFEDGTKGLGPRQWLMRVEGVDRAEAQARYPQDMSSSPKPMSRAEAAPPKRWDAAWPAVRQYLTVERRLPESLVDGLYRAGRLYATGYGSVPYVVFPLENPAGQTVGAIVRCAGTPEQQHAQEQQGYALKRVVADSDVTRGWWSPGFEGPAPRQLVLVEAPIDAIALAARFTANAGRYPADVAIRACGGSALNPANHTAGGPWTRIIAAFDADEAGHAQAKKVWDWAKAQQPPIAVTRAMPAHGKDWAEDWAARHREPSPFEARQAAADYER